MRYQVRVAEPADYGPVASLLRDEACVVLELPRRRTLAVEGLGDALIRRVRNMGATVEEDYEFAVDPLRPADAVPPDAAAGALRPSPSTAARRCA
jgi:hypothetical protein